MPTLQVRQEEAAQQFQQTVNASLDETKKNIRKSIGKSRNQIPQYTDVVKNYQERALESSGKMVEDFLEAQKSVINSVFSSANVNYENVQRMYSYWLYTRDQQNYGPDQLAISQKISAATRINNDILFGNIDAFGNVFERIQRQTEEYSQELM